MRQTRKGEKMYSKTLCGYPETSSSSHSKAVVWWIVSIQFPVVLSIDENRTNYCQAKQTPSFPTGSDRQIKKDPGTGNEPSKRLPNSDSSQKHSHCFGFWIVFGIRNYTLKIRVRTRIFLTSDLPALSAVEGWSLTSELVQSRRRFNEQQRIDLRPTDEGA